METLEPEEQARFDKLTQAVAKALETGQSEASCVEILVRSGWKEDLATKVVRAVAANRRELGASPQVEEQIALAKREAGTRNMWMGGVICAVGVLVTVGTYSSASTSGGHYVVAWGAIVFGAIRFFRGLSQST